MNRRCLLAWSLGIVFIACSSALADDVLRIATFNCECMSRTLVHVKFGLPYSKSDWNEDDEAKWKSLGTPEECFQTACGHVAKVIDQIADKGVHVLVLTEVGPQDDLDDLYAACEDVGVSHQFREKGSGTGGQHVAICSQRALTDKIAPIPGREFYDTELDDAEAQDDTGVSKGLHVVFEAGGKKIHVYALHLKSELGGHESDAQRVAQASIVRRHYLRYLEQDEERITRLREQLGLETEVETEILDKYVIVAGDLNDNPGEPTLRRIRGKDDFHADLIQTWHTPFFHEEAKWKDWWSYEYQGELRPD